MESSKNVRALILGTLVLMAAGAALAGPATLPAQAPAKGSLDRWQQPGGKLVAYRLFERGQPTYVGVASADGAIVWQRNAGLRPMVQPFWSADGAALLVVTDCVQPDAELRSPVPNTASWLIILDASSGRLEAQGDLDADVLDLPHKLPEAAGAAHELDAVTLENGVVKATIRHRDQTITGEAPLEALKKKHPAK